MADINTVYSGTIDRQDPDMIIAELPGLFPWSDSRKIYFPDEVRDEMRKLNADAISTVQAVRVPFSGTTADERKAWLTERLQAVNNRVSFIKDRTTGLLNRLKDTGSSSYDAVQKVFTSALSLVPIVGSVVSYFSNQAQAAQSLESFKVQTLIQDYVRDLGQLAEIRQQLVADLAALPTPTPTTTKPYQAPTPVPVWYYYVAAGFLLLLFVWYRRRKSKRSKR